MMKSLVRIVLGMLLACAVAAAVVWWCGRGAAPVARPLDPAFLRLTLLETAALPEAHRFDMPLGSEQGAMTYNARAFRTSGHLGDDLNGIGGGNTDLGDPVYAAGAGRVVYAGFPHETWGNMVIVAHRLPAGDEAGPVVQTVYAHLQTIRGRVGEVVRRGEIIGTVGTAKTAPLAHLHFEIRRGAYVNPGQGYADVPLNRLSPEAFIRAHRGAGREVLNPAPQAAP